MRNSAGTYRLSAWQLTAIIVAGTLVRFFFGGFTHSWYSAPDQLAWGLSLDEMLQSHHWRYIQIIHAPHEGGSFLIGLLSLALRPFDFLLPPLSLAALLVDTASRLVQVRIAQKLFGGRVAAWFGLWTVLAVPLLIPWATIDFGLHALSAFFPFVFLYLAQTENSKHLGLRAGLFAAVALSFSYDNIALLPPLILCILTEKQYGRNLVIFFLSFGICMLPHLYTRLWMDTGYFAENAGLLAGKSLAGPPLFAAAHFTNLRYVWSGAFPASFMLSASDSLSPALTKNLVSVFVYGGFLFFAFYKGIAGKIRLVALLVIFFFIAAYCFSPFFADSISNHSFVYYRHLAYIIPFAVLLMIAGFIQKAWGKWVIAAWLIFCAIETLAYLQLPWPVKEPAYAPAGWILAKKYGSDAGRLFRIHSAAPAQYRDTLAFGFGWGLSAALLSNPASQKAVPALVNMIQQSPLQYRSKMVAGVRHSFEKGITPVLDGKLLRQFDSTLLQ
ncbi:MAG: hypothetical protein JO301_00265 [Chitinophagaceae bacterium]|nr:hypothetical protein [Chitinophagaceae bacterium]